MKFHLVESSNIESIAHDPALGDLHVKFKNGGHYAYPGVSADQFEALKSAESVGKHFHQNIRSNFTGKRLDDKDE